MSDVVETEDFGYLSRGHCCTIDIRIITDRLLFYSPAPDESNHHSFLDYQLQKALKSFGKIMYKMFLSINCQLNHHQAIKTSQP